MNVLILSPQWGFEHLHFEDFLIKIKEAGFDGVDAWVPEQARERSAFVRLLREYELPIVCHQHQAKGDNINEFCRSFEYYLNLSLECGPVLINSHSARDYFDINQQLKVVDLANEFSVKNNIRVVHETHRGRLAYSPYNAKQLFDLRPELRVTADLSHWVCVTESYLDRCAGIIDETIVRTEHIHARVGHTQGPQVPDPRMAEWQYATDVFMGWWARILEKRKAEGREIFTITTEFGPWPYMLNAPATGQALACQFELNCFMKNLIRDTLLWN